LLNKPLLLSKRSGLTFEGVANRDLVSAPKRLVPSELPNKLYMEVDCVLLKKLPLGSIFILEPKRLTGFYSGPNNDLAPNFSVTYFLLSSSSFIE
jgi:hypothetical protein